MIQDFNDPIEDLMESTYPNFLKRYNDENFLKDRAILGPTQWCCGTGEQLFAFKDSRWRETLSKYWLNDNRECLY